MPSSFSSHSKGYDKVPLLAAGESDSEEELYDMRPSNGGRYQNGRKSDSVSKVKAELESAMDVMRTNIGKVLDRGDKLEDLEAKSETFEMNAFNFRAGSTKLKQKLWWQNCKLKLIFAALIVAGLLIIIVPLALKGNKKS